ncbi:site-specific DNA-methyltransferase [Klebsiella pneumoniae]|nr:site-specific DNA-methyltransferase [Klebsiella pneumoniae]RMA31521.1 site-specific DNA-methyltransferase [Klebsiella pneumoniae]
MKKITSDMTELQSMNITEDNISKLNSLFPEAFNENGIDFDVLKQLLGENVDDKEERYGLNWHGKRQARQLALTPSRGTLRPCKDESVNWDNTKNVMIEGDNLEVLKLLQKSYAGKVKLIYIDPPYNTGKDFVYPDNFQDNMKNYLEITGQTEDGNRLSTNTETSGRYHTDWLNMMYPRLKLARNLLANSGFIFISIDENELHNLCGICFEIFGEENFISLIANTNNPKGRSDDKFIATAHEYILVMAKNINYAKTYGFEPDNKITKRYNKTDENGEIFRDIDLRKTGDADRREDRPDMFYYFYYDQKTNELFISRDQKKNDLIEIKPIRDDGTDGRWRWGFDTAKSKIDSVYAKFMPTKKTWGIMEKDYLSKRDAIKATSSWTHKDVNSERGSEQFIELGFEKEVFSRPKPLGTLLRIVEIATHPNEKGIALDFFGGSGTFGHAVFMANATKNRKINFIITQLPEPVVPETKEQIVAASFLNKNGMPLKISEITKERLRRAGKKVREDNPEWKGDVGFRVFKLDTSNIRPWEATADTLSQQIDAYVSPILEGRSEEDLLTELMLKRGIDLSVDIETRQFDGLTVSCVDGGKLFTCFAKQIPASSVEELTKGIIDWHKSLKVGKDTVCYFLDDAFENNVAKTNLCAILEQHGLTNLHSL